MTKYNAINDLGVIHIQTTDDFYPEDPGLAATAILQSASSTFLQSYVTLDDVLKDYSADTKVYAEAAAYFNNAASPLFQVLNYGSGSGAASSTPSANSNGGSSAPVITVPSSSEADSAVAAVKKYFGAPWEHLIIPVTSSNHDVAVQVAEFVEAQHNKLVYLEIPANAPADGSGPDFSFLKELKGDGTTDNPGVLSVTAQSAPSTDEANGYDLGGALLSVYANSNLGFNPQFIEGLQTFSNVRPQDFYNFTRDDLDRYYTPYNVWTYEYRNNTPMFSGNFSIGGYEIMPMFTRDAIIKEVKANILNLFEQNGGIQYNTPGISMVLDQIRIVLNDFTKRGLIQNASVTTINPDKIKEATKASGHLSGLGWTWQPVWGINDVTFHQGIELPEL